MTEPEEVKKKKRPANMIGAGLAIGVGVGVALGNIAVGIAVGLAIGVTMDSYRKDKHKRAEEDEEE